ncbi:MAG TPA: 4-(cytidine 5'-diphospho)-2-C-methyl-D-erythritol kinase [Candidatus Limnocylindria bacterium]|nr:4-(cytidine 5'-diphospho)-2-C-methyl-D-erythritol kinase [Candidatus Limnocylindria bacterium]
MTLTKPSPCKVNLLLNILGKRADGFHELETVMQPINLCDELTFEPTSGGIELSCSEPSLPTDASNLVHRAASAFFEKSGISGGAKIHLEKRIPMAAGLGGGSGNAATTLLALNELFDHAVGTETLHEIAASLGSDIPFFLQSQPALARGRGEKIESLAPFRALDGCAFLLVHPSFGIATAWAYKELARFPNALNGVPGRTAKLISLLNSGDLRKASREFYNSLEAPALEKYPWLAVLQDFLRENGTAAMMSGSGSTTFAITNDLCGAQELEDRVKEKFGRCWTAVVSGTNVT